MIVTLPLISIGQHPVSFSRLFEFFFGFRIALVLVRMILMGEPPVGFLQVLISSCSRNAQDFVIIAFINCHISEYY